MTIGTRHWMVAIGVAFGLHAIALLTLDLGRAAVVMGTGGGVRISLGEAVGPPAGVPAAPAPAPTPPPRPVAAPKPKPQPQSPPAPRAAPVAPPSHPRETTPPSAAATTATVTERPSAAQGGESGEQVAAVAPGPAGPAPAARAGERGLAGLDPEYVRRFLTALERQKQYPRAARSRRMEGTALLWVRLDRGGRVLAYEVEESSGHRVLDRAVLRAIERANPLPPLPASYPDAELEVVIPIAFRLR